MSEDYEHNKVVVKESVTFYNEFWVERCKTMHHEEEQKKRLSQWHWNSFDDMTNGECEERRNVKRTKLHIDRVQNENFRA